MFAIVAVIITVNVSAALFIAEYQLISIEIESKVIKLVLPPRDPVTVIVYRISLAVQSGDKEVTVNGFKICEPAAPNQV